MAARRLFDEDGVSGPPDDLAETIHVTRIVGHGSPVSRLEQPDDERASR